MARSRGGGFTPTGGTGGDLYVNNNSGLRCYQYIPVNEQGSKPGRRPSTKPGLWFIIAATLEYLSMLPSCSILFDLLHFNHARFDSLANRRVVCLPFRLRLWIAGKVPGYDPYLKAWPKTAKEYAEAEKFKKRLQARFRRFMAAGRWLDAYEFWWACRRPATRRRLTIPLYSYLGGDGNAFIATMGVFTWSGFLHALWYPLLPLYALLARWNLALMFFLTIWFGYSLLGLPVALKKTAKKRRG